MENYPRFEFSDPLGSDPLEFFAKHGFLHFNNFISRETVSDIRAEIRTIEEKFVERQVEKINGVPIKYGTDVDGRKIIQRFPFSSQQSPLLGEFLQDPRFQSLFPLLGDDAENPRVGHNEKDGLVVNHYINTELSKFIRMGWHTDCLRDVFYGKKIMPMLNVGIHLTDAKPGQGGLRILPGTHKQTIFGVLFKKPYFLDHRPDKNEVGLQTRAGDLTVHDGRLWHRVAQSTVMGEQSRRQVMYVPIISGAYAIKDEKSPTLIYQHFQNMVR